MMGLGARLKGLTLCLLAVAGADRALAEEGYYRGKRITIMINYAAGGPTDRVARDLAEALRKHLGASAVVIDNVGGAGGTIGAAKVAKAPADGHTLFLGTLGNFSVNPALYPN